MRTTVPRRGTQRAFTLIELLIVVAIIAILAAVAVPNFFEAQVRSKVSRVKSDFRSLAAALDSYMVDHNFYPDQPDYDGTKAYIQYVFGLTTPIAYIAAVDLGDPFTPRSDEINPWALRPDFKGTYQYLTYDGVWARMYHADFLRKGFVLVSYGPTRKNSWIAHYPYVVLKDPNYVWGPSSGDYSWPDHPISMIYDSTNGTRSRGDIGRVGGDFPGIPQQLGG